MNYSIDKTVNHTMREIGRQTPDGKIQWDHGGIFSDWDTPEGRLREFVRIEEAAKSLGLDMATVNLRWYTRDQVVTFTEPVRIN